MAKYANAENRVLWPTSFDGRPMLTIEDDGVGSARATTGSGLSGLHDRIEALNGTPALESPFGQRHSSSRPELDGFGPL